VAGPLLGEGDGTSDVATVGASLDACGATDTVGAAVDAAEAEGGAVEAEAPQAATTTPIRPIADHRGNERIAGLTMGRMDDLLTGPDGHAVAAPILRPSADPCFGGERACRATGLNEARRRQPTDRSTASSTS